MHFGISAVLFCAILAGFASATQSSSDKSYYGGEIDIDDDLEGSGGGRELSQDLESSGSGFGPDDEDSTLEPNSEKPILPKVVLPDRSKPANEDTVKFTGTGSDTSVIMNPKSEDRPTFFAQPGILAAVIGGAVVGLLCAILVVMFIVYRMRKKDEGSYALEEPKRSPTSHPYNRGNGKEFFA
ncbi:PREDICTED: syndecan-like [Nicrophorus vespilloides]|uniref:Syndecan n=1 Tax=Nicrophorus vespilloides TaxID=110193 RepID=A0ABM1M136_NICVS|nr:PREDICTED: syndecan-like [Nicrophorus vespilloides]